MRWAYTRRLRRPVLIIASCLAFFAGVLFARAAELPDASWLWVCGVAVVFSLRKHNVVTLLLLVVLCFGVGWWRGSVYMQKLALHQTFHFQKVTIEGRAVDDAVYGKRSQLEFTIANIRVASDSTPLVGNMTIRGFGAAAVYRGDTVRATGTVYPTRGNNLASMSFATLEVVQRGTSKLDALRRDFVAGLQSSLPEPAASFAAGILIGQRTTLPEATDEQLRRAGLTHIIAVSGYNLTIIVLACRRLLAKRSVFQATSACVALIGLFLLMTGFSPPIVRAAVVSMLALGAWYFGRHIQSVVLLLTAAAITVLVNPLYLWGNVSWYLSFLAFFGVLVLAPLITKRYMGGKEPHALVGILVESLCASLLVVPYILHIFGEVSLVSLPANVLVIPFIPAAMLLALIAGLAGMWTAALAGWFAWPANMLITYMLDTAALLSRVPHAFITHIGFSGAYMWASYALISAWCLSLRLKSKQKYATITDKTEIAKEGA